MGLIFEGDGTALRRKGTTAKLRFVDAVARGPETPADIETRIGTALSAQMQPYTVAVHFRTTGPSPKYQILLGPLGSVPHPSWWNRFEGL